MRRRNIINISVGIKYICHHNKKMVVKWNDLSNCHLKKKGKEKVHESNKKRFSCWSVNTCMMQLQLPSFRTGGY